MKKLELYGTESLSQEDLKEISGGCFWVIFAAVVAVIAAVAALVDYVNEH